MLISRKGDGEQEQSVPCRHEQPPSKKVLLASTTAIFPGSRHDLLLQGTPPSCSSIMQNGTQCGADSGKDLVSLDHSAFLLQSSELTISTEEHLNFPFC